MVSAGGFPSWDVFSCRGDNHLLRGRDGTGSCVLWSSEVWHPVQISVFNFSYDFGGGGKSSGLRRLDLGVQPLRAVQDKGSLNRLLSHHG